MNNVTPFDWLGDRVSQRSALSRPEARGMLRMVLRDCGLQADTVTVAQLKVVVLRALGAALARVKVDAPEQVCAALAQDLESAPLAAPKAEDPADIFGRLGR